MNESETLIELYFKALLVFPVPNHVFKFDVPKTVLVSRRDTVIDLEKKLCALLNIKAMMNGDRSTIIT